MASDWKSYIELAWTEEWLATPEEYRDETMVYINLIKKFSSIPIKTLLHLASGAGGQDTIFKEHFTVTGVDLSKGMLDMARKAHPEIEYFEGDMRNVRLNKLFDAVAIPDSIDYMTTTDDLRQAVETAALHLKPGGVLLISAKPEETYKDNNFAYTSEKDGINVTVLENNYQNPYTPNTYEATLMYLIRKQGALSIYTEHQKLGLFPLADWERILYEAGLKIHKEALNGVYDKYLLNDGEYPLTLFIGTKT